MNIDNDYTNDKCESKTLKIVFDSVKADSVIM